MRKALTIHIDDDCKPSVFIAYFSQQNENGESRTNKIEWRLTSCDSNMYIPFNSADEIILDELIQYRNMEKYTCETCGNNGTDVCPSCCNYQGGYPDRWKPKTDSSDKS